MQLPSIVMSALVVFLGAVIARFAWRYLRGDPGQRRFYGWLGASLMAVLVLVNTDDMRILVLAWAGTSLCLHPLILFYPQRSQARQAAQKKFILGRLADLLSYACVALVGTTLETYSLSALSTAMPTQAPLGVHVAAYLLVIVAFLKTAQMPFHGWLMQVMEAPTPVSALLHAGIVNIAGYVIIRMAPVLETTPGAQLLLVSVAGTSMVLAALVMSTKTSIKASLAWSTSAQLGFMLVQCGLGLYKLALFHLVAHSIYKAHAFLSSGTPRPAARVAAPRLARVVAVLLPAVAVAPFSATLALLWVMCAPVLATVPPLVAIAYFLMSGAVHMALGQSIALSAAAVVAAGCATVLGALQLIIYVRPRWLDWLYPHAFAGFYLDAVFTTALSRAQSAWRVRTPLLKPMLQGDQQ